MSRFVAALRDAHWLTPDRVHAFTRVLLIVLVGLLALIPWIAPKMHVGRDFAAFWTSAKFALQGHAADAYGEAERAAMAALFGPGHYPVLYYPPPALLLWLPFALLPFAAAVALWVAATGAAYIAAIRAVLDDRSIVPIIAFPAVLVSALYGQNSLFSAALLGAAAVTLQRYPAIAGALIGTFIFKPQLAILAPLLFLAARRWQAFVAAALTTLVLAGLAAVVFGIEIWSGFIRALPDAAAWNAGGVPGFDTFTSPFAAIRLLGGSAHVAWLVQGVTAAGAVIALIFCAWRRPGGAAEIALMVAATGLCVPFLGVYDMAIFAVPGAWLVATAVSHGWLPYERITLVGLYLSPLLIVPAGVHAIPLAPIAEVALIILVVRRVRHLPRA